MRGLLMRGARGVLQNAEALSQAGDNLLYQLGFLHFDAMDQAGILNQTFPGEPIHCYIAITHQPPP
jgi:hypothetical protein